MTRSTVTERDGLFELEAGSDVLDSPRYNHDIAPTKVHERTWNKWHITALWVGMAICVPTYTCLLYTSPSPRDLSTSRMPSSA